MTSNSQVIIQDIRTDFEKMLDYTERGHKLRFPWQRPLWAVRGSPLKRTRHASGQPAGLPCTEHGL